MTITNALYVPGIYLSMLEILTLSTLTEPREEKYCYFYFREEETKAQRG